MHPVSAKRVAQRADAQVGHGSRFHRNWRSAPDRGELHLGRSGFDLAGFDRGRDGKSWERSSPGSPDGIEDDQYLGGLVDDDDGGQAEHAEGGERDERADDQQ